jgi:hypothetical protein
MPRKPVASARGLAPRPLLLALIGLLKDQSHPVHRLHPLLCSGCAVVTDAAVTVVATTVKVGATVVETAVDVAAAGAKAVVGGSDEDEK